MSRLVLALVAVASVAIPAFSPAGAQQRLARVLRPPSRDSLAAITRRGRTLADYDRAARLGAEAVLGGSRGDDTVSWQLVRRTGRGWEVAFGELAPAGDRFLVDHLASPGMQTDRWAVASFDPPHADTGYFLRAARAIESAVAMFRASDRVPYTATAIPAEDGPWWWVYVYPTAIDMGVWPHGGDMRFRIAADGRMITDTRRLHTAITRYTPRTARAGSARGASGQAPALGDAPEDTDVFHVVQRRPAMPEVVTTRKFTYRVDVDGSIRFLGVSRR